MKGWQTWTGVALSGIIAILQGVETAGLIPQGIANTVTAVLAPLAAAFGFKGLGTKIERVGK